MTDKEIEAEITLCREMSRRVMTVDERVKETIKRFDFVATMNMAPGDWHAFLVAIITDARQDGAEAERARVAKMLDQCRGVYKQNKPPSLDPHEAFAKMTAIEYAIMIVCDWSAGPDYKENFMPMPY